MAKKRKKKKKVVVKKVEQPVVPVKNLYAEAITFAADCFRVGDSESVISHFLMKANPKFLPENIQFILHQGSLQIASEHPRDRGSIVSVHVKRYNEIIQEEFNKDFSQYDFVVQRKLQIQAWENILQALVAKESVLQIHAKETQVKIFNRLNAKVINKRISYDVTKLNFEQQMEFLKLIQKSKKTIELISVKKRDITEEVTEDIEHEVINTNITQIERENEPVHEVIPDASIALNRIKQKIADNMQKKAAEDFKRAGAKQKAPSVLDLTKKQ